MKLNQKIVHAIAPGPRRIFWDDNLSGFGVRITEGSVSFIVDFKVGAKRRRVVIGPTNLLPFARARDEAAEILVAARKGCDLTADGRRDVPTFKQVWREMIDLDRLHRSPVTIKDYADRGNRLLLPSLGNKLVTDVTPADVERVVGEVKGTRNKPIHSRLSKKLSTSPETKSITSLRLTAIPQMVSS